LLVQNNADQVQGVYFGEPVPASKISADVLKDFRKSLVVGEPADAKARLVKSVKG
jgi:hypothetical protein